MAQRFWRRGTSKLWWAPTVVDVVHPAVAELDTDLTADVASIAGFSAQRTERQVRVWGQPVVVSRLGAIVIDAPALTLYEYSDTNPLLATLGDAQDGNLILFPAGYGAGLAPAAGDLVDVWPVTSRGPGREITLDTVAAHWRVSFAVRSGPVLAVALV